MDKKKLRLDILSKVGSGELPLETASRLLNEIERVDETDGESPQQSEPEPIPVITGETVTNHVEKPGWAVLLWLVPLILGIVLTATTANSLYQKLSSTGMNSGFWFTLIPLAIGIILIYLGWVLQQARWIHLEIQQPVGEKPERILLAFPLPFRLIGSFMRTFDSRLPQNVRRMDLYSVFESLDQQINQGEPLYVNVDDDDGTRVKIYIG